jgi:hypothetical protein
MKTCTVKAWETIKSFIDIDKIYHHGSYREVKPYDAILKESINIGYYQSSYGDWSFYVTPTGEIVATYFSIGD